MKPTNSVRLQTSDSPPIGSRSSGLLRQYSLAVSFLMLSGGIGMAADLLQWDLTGAGGATGSGVAATISLGVNGSGMSSGPGTSTGNSTSPSGTWNRTFNYQPDLASALAADNYFEFTTSADAGFTVSIDSITGMNLDRTSDGPDTAGLFYSTDGTTFTQTGTTVTVTTAITSFATEFSSTMSVTPIVMNEGETITWRLVVSGGAMNPATGGDDAGRIGIGNGGSNDVGLTGDSVPGVVAKNLL